MTPKYTRTELDALQRLAGELQLENAREAGNLQAHRAARRRKPSVYETICSQFDLRGSRDDVLKQFRSLLAEQERALAKQPTQRKPFDPLNSEVEDTDQ